jgi:hypothetical protein
MGILDDAIREHLDLKRRRGADPAEVERAEREALGPVRRNREQADLPEVEQVGAAAGGFAYDHAEDEEWSHDPLRQPGAQGVGEDLAEPDFGDAGLDPGSASPSAGRPLVPPEHDSFPTASPSPPPLSDMGAGETVEYNIEDALASEAAAQDAEHHSEGDEGEDVLEETPDFLQDTPDHDRLWFEQRPPRDFDFDG